MSSPLRKSVVIFFVAVLVACVLSVGAAPGGNVAHATIKINSSVASLIPYQNCQYAWSNHCRWVEANFRMCKTSGYYIYDATAGVVLSPSAGLPLKVTNWGCNMPGGHTQFGIETTYATWQPLWRTHRFILYY